MQVSATQVKNRFGAICAEARIALVYVERDGRIDTVILSVQQFEALKLAADTRSLASLSSPFAESACKACWFFFASVAGAKENFALIDRFWRTPDARSI